DQAVNDQFERGATLKSRHGDNLALALSDWKAKIGQPVPNFSLLTPDGKTVSLYSPRKKAAVVFIGGFNCPASAAYGSRISDLASDAAYKDVHFFAILYNTIVPASRRGSKGEIRSGLQIPIGAETKTIIADHLGATVTPTVWVVNA